jgi:hypothetical protein
VVASADLGGLGDREGTPVEYEWVPPSPLPRLLPWLGVLLLLALAANRTAKAWWIWAPLLLLTVGENAARPLLGFIPSSVFALFCLAFNSLAFGVAGVWLLAPQLNHRLRFVVFLKMLGVVAGFSAVAYLVRADWEAPAEAVGFVVFLAICVLIAVTGLALAGLLCRGRYRPVDLTIWLAVAVAVLWLLVASPFVLLASAAGNSGDWTELAQALLSFAGMTYAVVLSFLVLAFASGFYRLRLITLLRFSDAASALPTPPPVFTDAPQRVPTATPDIGTP